MWQHGTAAIRAWLKLRLFRSRIRTRYFESCFGPYPQKYAEYFEWFRQATALEGDILEFGVASGGTTCLMAQKLLEAEEPKIIHSFDSFQGFDQAEFAASHARGEATDPTQKDAWKSTEYSLPYVESKLKCFGFSRLVRLHPGFFQDSLRPFLDQNPSARFCFVLVDCDLADSIQFCAEEVYEYVTPGGVILFDDYGGITPGKPRTSYSAGVQRAVDEFVARHAPEAHGFRNGLYYFVKRK